MRVADLPLFLKELKIARRLATSSPIFTSDSEEKRVCEELTTGSRRNFNFYVLWMAKTKTIKCLIIRHAMFSSTVIINALHCNDLTIPVWPCRKTFCCLYSSLKETPHSKDGWMGNRVQSRSTSGCHGLTFHSLSQNGSATDDDISRLLHIWQTYKPFSKSRAAIHLPPSLHKFY